MLNSYYSKRTFDTKEISAKELTELAYRANLECNFLNNPAMQTGKWDQAIEIFEPIANKHSFHIVAWYCIMECYKKLGKTEKANEIKQQIVELIDNEKRATDMFEKYGDLMPSIDRKAALQTQ